MLGYSELLTETCTYSPYTGVNKYNEKIYGEDLILNCFTSYEFSNQLGYEMQELVLNKIVFIDNVLTPNPFDKVDGLEIKKIEPIKGLKVPTIGWKIIL